MFDLFDADHSGFITVDNIKRVLGGGKGIKGANRVLPQSLVEDVEFERILEEVDIDGDGEISYEEFRDMIRRIFQIEAEIEDDNKGELRVSTINQS